MNAGQQPFDESLLALFGDMLGSAQRLPDIHVTMKLTEIEAEVGLTRRDGPAHRHVHRLRGPRRRDSVGHRTAVRRV